MQVKLRIMRVTYPEIKVPQWQGRRLRGFFASGEEAGSLLHNHGEAGESLYRYPLVQYKVIRQHPVIVAIEEGIREVYPLVMERQVLQLGDNSYPCGHLDIDLATGQLGATAEPQHYRFCAPWFGLNQANYQRYSEAEGEEEREAILRQVLIGNLLSLSKGLGVTVARPLQVQLDLKPHKVSFKNEAVLGFVGDFAVNYTIPALLGLGKSVSRGFGVVVPLRKHKRREEEPAEE